MALNVWDLIPVFGVYLTAPGDLPTGGTVTFKLSQRVTRTDGRVIYPGGAEVKVQIGNPDSQNATVRAAVRSAWRAADQAAEGAGFDGAAWDIWWDTVVLPAAVFTGFPASDDPDITQRGWTVSVTEALTAGQGKQYAIQPLLAHLANPIPGINLGTVEVPPGSPTVPAPVYAKGVAGGVAALDADGDVVDASGVKVTGGGDVASVNGKTGSVTLAASDVGAVPTTRTVAGKPLSANVTLAKGDVGLGSVDNTSDLAKPLSTAAQTALAGKADLVGGMIPTAQLPPLAVTETFVVASQAAMLALTAQRGDMAIRTDVARTFVLASDSPGTLADWKEVAAAGQVTSVAGRTGNVALTKTDVSLGNVDNTSDANKPVSTAQAAAINAKIGSDATVLEFRAVATEADLPAGGAPAGVFYIVKG